MLLEHASPAAQPNTLILPNGLYVWILIGRTAAAV